MITSSLQLPGTGQVAAGYSVGYGGLLRGLNVLAVPVQECPVVIVLFAEGVEGRRVADWGGRVQSIFHGRVFTASEGTSFCERLYNFLY